MMGNTVARGLRLVIEIHKLPESVFICCPEGAGFGQRFHELVSILSRFSHSTCYSLPELQSYFSQSPLELVLL